MMKDNGSKTFPFIAIVAVVAIVGIVVLVWSAKSSAVDTVTLSSDESVEIAEDDSALAGQAGASCTDSDPTNNLSIAGQVVYNGHTYADLCSVNALTQYYCLNGRVQQVMYPGGSRTYSCPSGCSNGACQQLVCGDSQIQSTEQCDDGNQINNDGCSTNCRIENNYLCKGSPSRCTTLKLVGSSCSASSECLSNRCLAGVCARGTSSLCTKTNFDDECDYGFYCGTHQVLSQRFDCEPKLADLSPCNSNENCISGLCQNLICQKGSAFSVCGIVNDAYPGGPIPWSYVVDVIAKASDLMYERTGIHFRLQNLVRKNDLSITQTSDTNLISSVYNEWLIDCFRTNILDLPNGAFIYGGDRWLFDRQGAGALTFGSRDLSSEGFINSYPSPHLGLRKIPAGTIRKSTPIDDAVKIFHEILHTYDSDGADVHDSMTICNSLLGSRYQETSVLGLTFSAIGWGDVCPHTMINFATIERGLNPSSVSSQKLVGQRCSVDSDCISNYCGTIPASTQLPFNTDPYKICMKRNIENGKLCFTNNQCLSGICLGLKCQPQTPVGTSLADFSLCTNNNQCRSGLCLGSRCFTLLPIGSRCKAAEQCASSQCNSFVCS